MKVIKHILFILLTLLVLLGMIIGVLYLYLNNSQEQITVNEKAVHSEAEILCDGLYINVILSEEYINDKIIMANMEEVTEGMISGVKYNNESQLFQVNIDYEWIHTSVYLKPVVVVENQTIKVKITEMKLGSKKLPLPSLMIENIFYRYIYDDLIRSVPPTALEEVSGIVHINEGQTLLGRYIESFQMTYEETGIHMTIQLALESISEEMNAGYLESDIESLSLSLISNDEMLMEIAEFYQAKNIRSAYTKHMLQSIFNEQDFYKKTTDLVEADFLDLLNNLQKISSLNGPFQTEAYLKSIADELDMVAHTYFDNVSKMTLSEDLQLITVYNQLYSLTLEKYVTLEELLPLEEITVQCDFKTIVFDGQLYLAVVLDYGCWVYSQEGEKVFYETDSSIYHKIVTNSHEVQLERDALTSKEACDYLYEQGIEGVSIHYIRSVGDWHYIGYVSQKEPSYFYEIVFSKVDDISVTGKIDSTIFLSEEVSSSHLASYVYENEAITNFPYELILHEPDRVLYYNDLSAYNDNIISEALISRGVVEDISQEYFAYALNNRLYVYGVTNQLEIFKLSQDGLLESMEADENVIPIYYDLLPFDVVNYENRTVSDDEIKDMLLTLIKNSVGNNKILTYKIETKRSSSTLSVVKVGNIVVRRREYDSYNYWESYKATYYYLDQGISMTQINDTNSVSDTLYHYVIKEKAFDLDYVLNFDIEVSLSFAVVDNIEIIESENGQVIETILFDDVSDTQYEIAYNLDLMQLESLRYEKEGSLMESYTLLSSQAMDEINYEDYIWVPKTDFTIIY